MPSYGIKLTLICLAVVVAQYDDQIVRCKNYTLSTKNYNFDDIFPLQISISSETSTVYMVGINLKTWRKVLMKTSGISTLSDKHIWDRIRLRGSKVNAVAANQYGGSHRVYIGCNTGLKIYSDPIQVVEDMPGIDHNIIYLISEMMKDNIYSVIWPDYQVYRYSPTHAPEGRDLDITVVKGSGRKFVIDGEENYYYQSQAKTRLRETFTFVRAKNDDTVKCSFPSNLNYLTVDKYGRVFGINGKSVYRLKNYNSTPQFVIALNETPTAMCFDKKNNMVFGGRNVFLMKYNYTCFATTQDSKDSGRCYIEKVLIDDAALATPMDMITSYLTGNIYILGKDNTNIIHYFDKKSNQSEIIEMNSLNTVTIYTIAVDSKLGKVYLGTNKGITVYMETTTKMFSLAQFTTAIRQIFVGPSNKELYVITMNDLKVRKHDSLSEGVNRLLVEKVELSESPINKVVVDRRGNYFFQENTYSAETKVMLKGESKPRKCNYDIELAVDHSGVVYGSANNTIFTGIHANKTNFGYINKFPFDFLFMNFNKRGDMYFVTRNTIIHYILENDNMRCIHNL